MVFKYEVLSNKYVYPGRGSKISPILRPNNSEIVDKGEGVVKNPNILGTYSKEAT